MIWLRILSSMISDSRKISRYELGMENWLSSQHLGEHVGGSAVRSICSVSKTHVFMPFDIPNMVCRQNGTSEGEDPFILISVGAKRVVTAWKQTLTTGENGVNAICSGMDQKNENNLIGSSAATASSLSFQWLSTDMPLRHNSYMKRQNKKVSETPEDDILTASDAMPSESLSPNCKNTEPNLYPEDNLENDWRYLEVTAFLVKEAGSRSVLVKKCILFLCICC